MARSASLARFQERGKGIPMAPATGAAERNCCSQIGETCESTVLMRRLADSIEANNRLPVEDLRTEMPRRRVFLRVKAIVDALHEGKPEGKHGSGFPHRAPPGHLFAACLNSPDRQNLHSILTLSHTSIVYRSLHIWSANGLAARQAAQLWRNRQTYYRLLSRYCSCQSCREPH